MWEAIKRRMLRLICVVHGDHWLALKILHERVVVRCVWCGWEMKRRGE